MEDLKIPYGLTIQRLLYQGHWKISLGTMDGRHIEWLLVIEGGFFFDDGENVHEAPKGGARSNGAFLLDLFLEEVVAIQRLNITDSSRSDIRIVFHEDRYLHVWQSPQGYESWQLFPDNEPFWVG